MSVKLYKGKTKFMWLPVTVSCPMYAGSLVRFVSGAVAPCRLATTNVEANATIVGVLRHDIASSDSDYATARDVEVEVPVENYVQWEVDFTDTVVAADVGLYVDLYDTSYMLRGSSTYDHAQIVKRISANKAVVVLNTGVAGFGSVGAA
jgi:hypothetical protein